MPSKEIKSLDQLISEKRIDKLDFYATITNQKAFSGSLLTGRIHSFTINPRDIDKIYLAVKKVQRNYDLNNPSANYYEPCFEKIDEAYLNGNPRWFQDSVSLLLQKIVLDHKTKSL